MTALDAIRQRLRSFADDCDQRASQARNPQARGFFHLAARNARQAMAGWYGGDRRKAVVAMEGLRLAAQWIEDPDAQLEGAEVARVSTTAGASIPEAPKPPRGLKPSALAELAGMTERGARKRIVHCYHRGLPGFYRTGRRWFAEPEAFAQFRMSSDCASDGSVRA